MAYVSGSSVDQMALVAVSSRLPLLGFYGSSQVNHVSDLRQECGLGFVYLWFPRPSLSNSLVPSPTSGRHFVTGTCLCLSVVSENGAGYETNGGNHFEESRLGIVSYPALSIGRHFIRRLPGSGKDCIQTVARS